jgi:coatomer protein complex subunit gamma
MHTFADYIFHSFYLNDIVPSTLDTVTASITKRPTITASAPAPPTALETQSAYASQLSAIPQFASYGGVINSSAKPIALTESETEYVVTCVKHIFKENIVFQVSMTGKS